MSFRKVLTESEYDFCSKIISADAFAAIVMHHLATEKAMSCIRASDGERGLLAHALNNADLTPFLKDDTWLTRYGVKGADLRQLGLDIMEAGNTATFLAPTISGVWLPWYSTVNLFYPRPVYVDTFFPYNWARDLNAADRKTGYVVMDSAKSVFLAHHEYIKQIDKFKSRGITTEFSGYPLTSWTQHDEVIAAIQAARPELVLICGGPHGKVLVNKISKLKDQQRVVLDTGSAVESVW